MNWAKDHVVQIPTLGLEKPAGFVISYIFFYFDQIIIIFSLRTFYQILFISHFIYRRQLNFSCPKKFVKWKQVKIFCRYDITKISAVWAWKWTKNLKVCFWKWVYLYCFTFMDGFGSISHFNVKRLCK